MEAEVADDDDDKVWVFATPINRRDEECVIARLKREVRACDEEAI